MIPRTQPVSMPDQEFLTIPFKFCRFMVYRNIQFFFKIAPHPHIMIANKKIDRYACIRDPAQLTQYAHISLRHYLPVFVPEIKQITDDNNCCSFFFDISQELNDTFLSFKTKGMVRRAQMKVR